MNKKFIIILIITGFSLYLFSLFGKFLWDDEEQIVNNQIVHSIGNIGSFLTGSTFNTGGRNTLHGIYYKPMLCTCYSLIYSLFGAKPFYFHLLQVLLHIANATLVYMIFRYLFRKKLLLKLKLSEYSAFLISLIFLVHPINTESVAYISALQDVLYLFWGALGLTLVMFKNSIKIRDHHYYLLISLCLLFSLLSKESGVLFLPIILVYSFIYKKKHLRKLFILVMVIFCIYLFIRLIIAKIPLNGSEGISPIMRIELAERLLCIPKIILFYIKTYFYPKNLIIAQHWIVNDINFKDFYLPLSVCIALFALIVLFANIIYRNDKKLFKLFIFFVSWFLIGLALHIQIFPLDMTVADRWFYFPQIGLIGMLFIIIYHFSKKQLNDENYTKTVLYFTLFISAVLSFRTFSRILDWSSGYTLYKNDIRRNPDAFDLTNNLGVEYYRRGEIEEAKKYFAISTEITPYWWTNWNNLGVVYEVEGDWDNAEIYYRKAIENGDYFLAYENLAKILYKQGKYDEAFEFLEKEALNRFPYNETLNIIYTELESQLD